MIKFLGALRSKAFRIVFIISICSSVLSTTSRHNSQHNNVKGSWTRGHQPFSQQEYSEQGDQNTRWQDMPALHPGQSSSSLTKCTVFKENIGSIPIGQTNETIKLLFSGTKEIAVEDCCMECCRLGPELCHYAWIFNNRCFAVSCTEDIADNCLASSKGTLTNSIYIQMAFSPAAPNPDSSPLTITAPGTARPANVELGLEDVLTISRSPPLLLLSTEEHTHPIGPTNFPPSSTLSSSPPRDYTLLFSGETSLTLPNNSTHIFSSTWPRIYPGLKFQYQWRKVAGPDKGTLQDIDKKDLQLSQLVVGVYVLKLTMKNQLGMVSAEGTVEITVHPAVRVNTPPIPVIKPTQHYSIVLPKNSALFDASGSHDDMDSETLQYHWEEEAGPVSFSLSSDLPLLQLVDLKEGNYNFKLTVTDSEGLSADAYATVSVSPQPYYPPQAIAGNDYIIKLPNSQVTLDGSQSSAYEGSLQYSWVQLAGPGPVDLKGTSEPFLHLMHITSTGDYLFRLRVTDSHGKSSNANVSVIVIPENNLPPVADAGPDLSVQFPHTSASLNGSASTDDFKITSWKWTQIGGPLDIDLAGEDTSVLQLDRLHINESLGSPTTYKFQLCVFDYLNLTNITTVTVAYYKSPLVPPHVYAGPDLFLVLPQDTAILNASSSHDDFGIISYQWLRSEDSPAAGLVVEGSDTSPVLMVSGMVEGTYNFTLTAINRNHLATSDMVTVSVSPHPMKLYMLQVLLEEEEAAEVNPFSLADQRRLQRVLELMLDDITSDYDVLIQDVHAVGVHVRVEFYARHKDSHTPLNATLAYQKLTELGQDFHYPNSNFHFIKITMKVCQLACSNHGSCDSRTHKCRCSRYWMENPFKALFGRRNTNCDWSVFYVTLGVVLAMTLLLFLVWLTCWCCIKRRRVVRSKKRIRYAVLGRKGVEEGKVMLPQGMLQEYRHINMLTESDTDEEEDLLFESKNSKDGEFNRTVDAFPMKVGNKHTSCSPSVTVEGSTPT